MANPQPDIFISISKEWHKAIRKVRISGLQWQVLNTIISKTWGAFPRLKKAQISQEEFMEETGLNSTTISKTKKQLLDMGFITQLGNGRSLTYCIQKDYELWNPLPKKVTTSNGKGLQKPPKVSLPKKVMNGTQLGNEKKSHLIIVKKEELAITLYDFYKNEINPQKKVRKGAIKNILFYLKEYSLDDLKKSIQNYKTEALENTPKYRKGASNFFGRSGESERYFEDYLKENFTEPINKPPESEFFTGYK